MDSVSDSKTSQKPLEEQSRITSARCETLKYGGNLQPKGFPPLSSGWISEGWAFPSSCETIQLYAAFHRRPDFEKSQRRVLYILHGQGEHGGRYLHLPHYLEQQIDAVCTLDHRGHGRSGGPRGHVERFDLYVDDAAVGLDHLMRYLAGLPGGAAPGSSRVHLLGHSMGGLIGLRLLFLHANLPFRSAIISAPLVALRMKVPLFKRIVAISLSKMMGHLHLPTGLDAGKLSRDQEVQSTYLQDRLNHDKATPRFFTELEWAMADTLRRTAGIAQPVMAILGAADEIVDTRIAEVFFQSLKNGDKLIRVYDGVYHEAMNDLGKETVFGDIRTWIENHR